MAKYDSILPKSLNRARRIVARMFAKDLPQFVYRADTRTPATIRANGFQPWAAAGTITPMEHVNNVIATGPLTGSVAKTYSQFVSTAGYGFLKVIDPTFAMQILNTNLYKIDTAAALLTGPFYDANDIFDRAGVDRPYATQREWLKEGGVPQAAVVATMPGLTYANQLVGGIGPDENQLNGWAAF